ncbi:uncharacterized protein LOC130635425 [Hydractinia symbiolongicarpus]|uniref:uncharacterized protein LOC130635425 n=1 Tax=Hydractinia symbiolongicarpus TaxID=13093 RepID=UPI00254A9753|nr:uncharacterized protein LOC130635425 [Hydractinia symbiolongicarpus]
MKRVQPYYDDMLKGTYSAGDVFSPTTAPLEDYINDTNYVEFDDILPFPPEYSLTFEPDSIAPGCFNTVHDLECNNAARIELSKSSIIINRKPMDASYRTDQYLESYRLKVNARQKKRVAKMNELFRNLEKMLPMITHSSTGKKKPNSKLNILRRASQYIDDLSNLLSENKIK